MTSQTSVTKSTFIRACRREKTDYTPVWLMRQAGRFMPEYRKIRSRLGFLELCKRSDLAAELTVMAQEQLGVDAAIIFADILLPLEAMGVALAYLKGDGPTIGNPIASAKDVENLKSVNAAESLNFVLESIRLAKRALKPGIALIGFAGAPFTLASYLIEGGASRHFEKTKAFMYTQPKAWHDLMRFLASTTAEYLSLQISAGAEAVQLFDSWVGCLSPDDYEQYVLRHSRSTISGITGQAPIIHFGTGNASLLDLMKQAGGDVIGLDWRVRLDSAWAQLGYDLAVQGNLDPCVLLADKQTISQKAGDILSQAGGRSGHIFNLGHGVLPQTPVENVKYLVDTVHTLGSRARA